MNDSHFDRLKIGGAFQKFSYEWEAIRAVIMDRIMPRYQVLTNGLPISERWQSVLWELQLDELRLIAATLERVDPASIAGDDEIVKDIFEKSVCAVQSETLRNPSANECR